MDSNAIEELNLKPKPAEVKDLYCNWVGKTS
jgi:hypothetical protein